MKKGLIYSNQLSLINKPDILGYSNGSIYVKEIAREKANAVIKANHYSHKVYNASFIHLGVFDSSDKFVGVLQYGSAMNPASGGSVVKGTEIDNFLELNRMWLDDCAGRNSESQAISCSIVYIKHRFPLVKWIQSFADERCHCFGIVYQACSFGYYGEHTDTFWYLDDVAYHNINMTISKDSKRYKNNVGGAKYLQENKDRAEKVVLRQFRYIRFLDQSWKDKCLLKQKPYPKHYNETSKNLSPEKAEGLLPRSAEDFSRESKDLL